MEVPIYFVSVTLLNFFSWIKKYAIHSDFKRDCTLLMNIWWHWHCSPACLWRTVKTGPRWYHSSADLLFWLWGEPPLSARWQGAVGARLLEKKLEQTFSGHCNDNWADWRTEDAGYTKKRIGILEEYPTCSNMGLCWLVLSLLCWVQVALWFVPFVTLLSCCGRSLSTLLLKHWIWHKEITEFIDSKVQEANLFESLRIFLKCFLDLTFITQTCWWCDLLCFSIRWSIFTLDFPIDWRCVWLLVLVQIRG